MSNVNIQLSNTAAQIDQTVSETYSRLVGNYVGPLTASSNAASGFMIQNGNKQNGLFVGNSCTQFYNNNLKFDNSNSDTYIYIANGRNFYLTGNSSSFQFNNEGSASFGSTINPSYKGIQIYSTGASLILKDTDSIQNNSIRFFNSSDVQTFYICKNASSSLDICSVDSLNFYSRNISNPSLLLSGANASINSTPESNYNFKVSGKSYFTDCSDFSGCLNINNFINISNPSSVATGAIFNTISIFNKRAIFCQDIIISGNGSLIIQSGGVKCLTASGASGSSLSFGNGNFAILCLTGGVNNLAEFDSPANFKKQICIRSGVSFDNSYISGIGGSYIYSSGILSTGRLSTNGLFSVNSPGFSHEIRGSSLTINTTGNGNNLIFNSTPVFNCNLNVCGTGCFNLICSTGANTNIFSGNLNVGRCINAANLVLSNFLTGVNICYTNCLYGKGACLESICVYATGSTNLICGTSKFLGTTCYCDSVCLTDNASLIVRTTGNHEISGGNICLNYKTGFFSGYSCFSTIAPMSITQSGNFVQNVLGNTPLSTFSSGRNLLSNGCNFLTSSIHNTIYSTTCNCICSLNNTTVYTLNTNSIRSRCNLITGSQCNRLTSNFSNEFISLCNVISGTDSNRLISNVCNVLQAPDNIISGNNLCLCIPNVDMSDPQNHNQTATFWGTIYINSTGFKFPLFLI